MLKKIKKKKKKNGWQKKFLTTMKNLYNYFKDPIQKNKKQIAKKKEIKQQNKQKNIDVFGIS